MKGLFRAIGLSLAGSCLSATTLGLASITYPVYLAHNDADDELEIRALPFATRSAHPEFIGLSLSAPYVVPHNDTTDLPKDINLISVCGIVVKTELFAEKDREPEQPVGVNLTIDISNFSKPAYVPFDDSEVMSAVVKAIRKTLATSRCEIRSVKVITPEGSKQFRAFLEKRLAKPIAPEAPEPAPAD